MHCLIYLVCNCSVLHSVVNDWQNICMDENHDLVCFGQSYNFFSLTHMDTNHSTTVAYTGCANNAIGWLLFDGMYYVTVLVALNIISFFLHWLHFKHLPHVGWWNIEQCSACVFKFSAIAVCYSYKNTQNIFIYYVHLYPTFLWYCQVQSSFQSRGNCNIN